MGVFGWLFGKKMKKTKEEEYGAMSVQELLNRAERFSRLSREESELRILKALKLEEKGEEFTGFKVEEGGLSVREKMAAKTLSRILHDTITDVQNAYKKIGKDIRIRPHQALALITGILEKPVLNLSGKTEVMMVLFTETWLRLSEGAARSLLFDLFKDKYKVLLI